MIRCANGNSKDWNGPAPQEIRAQLKERWTPLESRRNAATTPCPPLSKPSAPMPHLVKSALPCGTFTASTKSRLSSLKGAGSLPHMNRLRLSLIIPTLPIVMIAVSALVAAKDHVIVQPRQLVIIRTGKVVRDFPERRKAIVRYPIVQGLADPVALRQIQKTLAIKNVFGSTLSEYRQESGLLSFDYKVNYNQNYLLDITFTEETEGAYPDTHTKHFLISLKNGAVVKAADAFDSSAHP